MGILKIKSDKRYKPSSQKSAHTCTNFCKQFVVISLVSKYSIMILPWAIDFRLRISYIRDEEVVFISIPCTRYNNNILLLLFICYVWLFATPWTTACQASLSFTVSWSLLKLRYMELVMPSSHLILCRPLLLLPSIFPSIRVFSNELALCIRWPEYWSSSFSISPSNEYSRLISFKTAWYDLPIQGIPAPQFESINSSTLSLLYGPTLTSVHDYWKNHSFNNTDLFGKMMLLLCNMLSRFVIAFLPRSKCLLISWLQSLSAVILEPKKIKSVTVSIVSPSICREVMGPDAMILVFWMLTF